MMQVPLTLPSFLFRAETLFPKKEIISRTKHGMFRYTYREYAKRTRQLSSILRKLGVKRGDHVGTLAWNDHRHLEAYFAIPCMGAVLHTINLRLSREHIRYIINHAGDKILIIDEDLIPIIESMQSELPTVDAYIILSDLDTIPATTLHPVYSYEALLKEGDPDFLYPDDLDENAPLGMCYTSATTGNPKGVIYSHRGIYLHSMCLGLVDSCGISETDSILPVVPMFHVNAWGMPFASVWFGARQVLPGPAPTPTILVELIAREHVTVAAGVPTVWLGVAQVLEQTNADISSLRAILCGGSAAPRALIETFEQKFGIPFIHAYGMTETTPVALVSRLKSYHQTLTDSQKLDIRSKQGLLVPGIEMKILGKSGAVKWDGQEMGELCFRGNWIADAYYQDDRSQDAFVDGWLHTGDIGTIDEEGYVKIMDRTKDLVKSGGEWISTVELENTLMAHPAVFEAAVIGIPHPKWQERPIACVVLKEGFKNKVEKLELLNVLQGKFAKWWIPDDVLFLEEIPKTSVGKFLKRALRDQLRQYYDNSAE
ncbi:long-chain fatty acid--CoA ligase [Fodinisporobacter ferrooxydans]|uniref:Long-chain fatty acid--CoA ligase n=1 Tax=Fodinisporobacter ferrooxydans TaxID=2901836 RepID=A0ABY4CHG0_9BACL|nr:long-chain fatty acid--CoA ligase [Alicyclobacillaceae bacterium MYW30-H2]